MQFTTATIAALSAILGSSLATPVDKINDLRARGTVVPTAPAECNFASDTYDENGSNWCLRGYYADDNTNCNDQTTSTWAAPYYTQADNSYCTCHSLAPDTRGKHPVSVGVWFKGAHNPNEIDIFTSDVASPDGRCYSYQREDGTTQSNGATPEWSKEGFQFFCLWLNHTNVGEEALGFSSKKYVGNPQCPY